jgi:O-antigen/teichoic acid export membrane protein
MREQSEGATSKTLIARRLTWGLGDQAVSSMTNFVVGVFVARELGVAGFGIFSLAWVTYGVVLNVSRGLATDPLVVRYSGASTADWREATSRAAGTALAVGVAFGVASALAGFAMGGTLGAAFVALAVVTPGMLLQDSWRFAFFAAGQGHKAFLNDSVWAVAMIPLLLLVSTHRSVWIFVLAWGGASLLAAGGGWLQSGIVPHFSGVTAWLRQHKELGSRYLIENVSNSGGVQLRMYGLGAIAGLADVGAVRGAELLLGPFLALLMGLNLVLVPEAARVLRQTPDRLARFCVTLGGVQAVAAASWGAILLFVVPDALGRLVLDDVWAHAQPLILPVSLSVTGAGVVAGAAAGLRALGAARRSVRVQLVASTGYLGFGLIGAALGGAVGMSWGSTTAMWLGAGLWWLQLRAGLRDHVPQPQPEPNDDLAETRTP